jgi:hypothetical protein
VEALASTYMPLTRKGFGPRDKALTYLKKETASAT